MNPLKFLDEYLWVVKLVALAVLVGLSFAAGYRVASDHYKAGLLDQAKETIKQTGELAKAADAVESVTNATRSAHAEADRAITKEVIRYVQVTRPADRCTLPGTWRMRHDAAALGVPIDPGSGPVAEGADSPVDDATALETIDGNYRLCREWRDKLDAWQLWHRQVIHHDSQGDLASGSSIPPQ